MVETSTLDLDTQFVMDTALQKATMIAELEGRYEDVEKYDWVRKLL